MRRLSALCRRGGGGASNRRSRNHIEPEPKENRESMANSEGCSQSAGAIEEIEEMKINHQANPPRNIILNHDFSEGLSWWYSNCCEAYVVSEKSGTQTNVANNLGGHYVVVTKRRECWQGLEQDITNNVYPGFSYLVSVLVSVGGAVQGPATIQATLRLEYEGSPIKYLCVAKVSVVKEKWEELKGSFSLTTIPKRVVFYLEGPSLGVDLHIRSVSIYLSHTNQHEEAKARIAADEDENIVQNPRFEDGLNNWSARGCKILLHDSMGDGKVLPFTGSVFASATERAQNWNGIQQEITGRVQRKLAYEVAAVVRLFGNTNTADVRATLWVQAPNGREQYIGIANLQASDKEWVQLQGKFLLNSSPSRAVIYLEGPPPGTDILVNSLVVKHAKKLPPSSPPDYENVMFGVNILTNGNLDDGVNGWFPLGSCTLSIGNGAPHVLPPMARDSLGAHAALNGRYILVTNRTQNWMGPAQVITDKLKLHVTYQISAWVRVGTGGNGPQNINVALGVDSQWFNGGQVDASTGLWYEIGGSFRIEKQPSKVIVYIQGPSSGVDLMVGGLQIFPVDRKARFKHLKKQTDKGSRTVTLPGGDLQNNVIMNHDFSEGLHSWHANSCDGHVILGESDFHRGVTAKSGCGYAIISRRTENWQGLEQDIAAKLFPGSAYCVSAWVRVWKDEGVTEVRATLKLEHMDSPTTYLCVGRALVGSSEWVKLEGSFTLASIPKRVVFFLEGPPPGVDLLIDSIIIYSRPADWHEGPLFGTNIIKNSSLNEGLGGWYPLGSCTLKVCTGSPRLLPPVAMSSLGQHNPLSGLYILSTNRTDTWMGPAQNITEKLKLHLTYQVSAWVRVGSEATCLQTINVALGVDDSWVNGGQVEANGDRWYELAGSFRIEKRPSKVIAYIQGPSPGVNLMVAGFQIFPVDRKARFIHLKEQINKVRKRDVVLRLSRSIAGNLFGATVKVRQITNSFPFGSCINRPNLDNEDFVDFFLKNFNWGVFGNELKWSHTEPQQGKLNYTDADEMLNFCKRHGIETRGHCIFWEVKDTIQSWVQSLSITDLMTAVQNRLTGLLLRYKGQFRHYDVNNEMLHGSFYQDRLGKDIRAYMFKAAHQLDPSAKLFVNDYHIEDGCDAKSSPEMYIQQILDLQERGAPIGGIGIQGHIHRPVGPVICSALDKLAILGLPIWFTELDVSADNEYVRADDLEVMLREAYGHPAVEGIVLWGFWETFMCSENSHLVNAEGDINEAGRRYLELKQEWMSNADGEVDSNSKFKFRGFHGTYSVEVVTPSKTYSEIFVVEKGDSPQIITINF